MKSKQGNSKELCFFLIGNQCKSVQYFPWKSVQQKHNSSAMDIYFLLLLSYLINKKIFEHQKFYNDNIKTV